MNQRTDGRTFDQLREIKITPGYVRNVPGSVLIEHGHTRVLCTATYEERVPFFRKNSGKGWVSAEYAMLPGSTGNDRVGRERDKVNKRNVEIQRLVSRALRTTFDLSAIDGINITIDADVLQADGGTRCASVNGGMAALYKSLRYLMFENIIRDLPPICFVGAVSLGVKDGDILVDLNYEEDSSADADINIISSEDGKIVEVQALGEENRIEPAVLHKVIDLGIEKNHEIIAAIKKSVGG